MAWENLHGNANFVLQKNRIQNITSDFVKELKKILLKTFYVFYNTNT